jgi:hypothetical protein
MGPTRERLSVCLFIGALGVNFRICRRERGMQQSAGCAGGPIVAIMRRMTDRSTVNWWRLRRLAGH